MGIKSTIHITRQCAIDRIKDIDYLIFKKKYKSLEDCTSEYDYDLKKYINNYNINYTDEDLDEWTDAMLEDKMDEPYYRFSMFDNYLIKD